MDDTLNTLTRDVLEVITPDELLEVLKKDEPVVYTGYEPSGKVHLGHAITIRKLREMQDAGFRVKILLADYHAYLNGKGSMERIREMADYNRKCFLALGLSPDKTEFILGSSFQTQPEYTDLVYRMALITTLTRARRSMAQITRESKNHKVAEVIYPLMQVIDMVYLDVDVALGGMEQRKIHMLARENLPRLGFDAPVCIHTPLLHGTDGSEKMSSSKGNFIAVDDSPDEIREKVKGSYCPMGELEGNPIIEIVKYFIMPEYGRMTISRPEKFGGDLELDLDELLNTYSSGDLHPLDLKNAVSEYLIDMLGPVRDYMEGV
ncbi:tyrosine--tRNA ligase [Methanothermobacter sp.]|uniref:tyrosine--tRNA ligase n=1 Tax=Methanothermobacter sp. TaxID=1884223 RepID=UPI00261F06C2|nr:tyrosine--tRNA ligase [Methanothermobacter sp.]MDI9618872.1 tyrosine--tRNA ligase [Methanothermobacter sp.]